MREHLTFPFPDQRFPEGLGAVIQQTVLSGEMPARLVVHTDHNSWMVGDGITDPNAPGACAAAHMAHVVRCNSSVAALSSLPLGHQARREGPGHPWIVSRFEWESEPDTPFPECCGAGKPKPSLSLRWFLRMPRRGSRPP